MPRDKHEAKCPPVDAHAACRFPEGAKLSVGQDAVPPSLTARTPNRLSGRILDGVSIDAPAEEGFEVSQDPVPVDRGLFREFLDQLEDMTPANVGDRPRAPFRLDVLADRLHDPFARTELGKLPLGIGREQGAEGIRLPLLGLPPILLGLLLVSLSFRLGIDAASDHLSPGSGDVARVGQGHARKLTYRAGGGVVAPRISRDEDEGADAIGRRAFGDADAEAGNCRIPPQIPLARLCGLKSAQHPVGEILLRHH